MSIRCSPSTGVPVNNQISMRQHFNYLRNNSCGMNDIFNWPTNQASLQDQFNNGNRVYINNNIQYLPDQQYQNNINNKTTQYKNRNVTFQQPNNNNNNNNNRNKSTNNYNNKNNNNSNLNNKQIFNQNKKRPNSANTFTRKSKLIKDQQAQRQKQEQNRKKVLDYIQQIRPYTRNMSNSRFQNYFNKAAPQCYGRANTNQPIGGIQYGNNLKTFNVNPHVYTNKPQYYQTHNTAINFGKRAKVCQDKKWKRLQKQLTKKLGLKQKNQTIKQGKQVIYIDVDDTNKQQVLKQNHQFQKANRDQIRALQLDYKKQKHLQYLDNINQYYAKKQQKIAQNLSTMQTIDYSGQNLSPQDYQARLNQQMIYRYTDKHGNVRMAADRHGMTCFVDMNFPENQAAYIQQLNNRMPIFPKRVQGQDLHLDAIRKANCKKGHQQVYPSHYLLRKVQQPEVLKMLSNKTGVNIQNKFQGTRINNQRKSVGQPRRTNISSPDNYNNTINNKSFASTNYSQSPNKNIQNYNRTNNYNNNNILNQSQIYGNQNRNNYDNNKTVNKNSNSTPMNDNLRLNKSQIINSAFQNPQVINLIQKNRDCCYKQHLPHNEMDPYCYKNASGKTNKIPYAG